MRKFLLGMLVGVMVATATYKAIDAYSALNQRVSYIEGYLRQLDQMMRQQSNADVMPADSRRAA